MAASDSPSASPSVSPSASPSVSPSGSPSISPSVSPSASPSVSPSASPSPIPSGDVVYTIHEKIRIGKKRLSFVKIAFGGDNDAYPAGGIPLTLAGLGFASQADAIIVLETNASAFTFEWDRSANTLRMFDGFGTEESTAETLAAKTLECLAIGW